MSSERQKPGPKAAFPDDPRSLSLAERLAWAKAMAGSQRSWQRRLPALVEPPPPADDFPAFLLDTPPFRELHRGIGEACHRRQLPLAIADDLQHFVDAFRDYLRDCANEQVFPAGARRTG